MGNTNEVDAFLARLDHPLKGEIEAVRAIILGVDERIRESIKWKVRENVTDMAIDDPAGLLRWAARDRCVATFADMREIEAKKAAFAAIVRQWIERL